MTAAEFYQTVLTPASKWCLAIPGWKPHFDDRANVLLTAISGQEAAWTERIQSGNGPAHGLFQFERRGGVAGVLGDMATWKMAVAVCRWSNVQPNSVAIWNALALPAHDDLAVAFARLLLWSDPAPLPAVGDTEGAYRYYLTNWRPGSPSRIRWSTVYPQAVAAVQQGAKE